jgi:hypothetical protein
LVVQRLARLYSKRDWQAANYAARATGFTVCASQFQGMSSCDSAAGQSAAIFPMASVI